jgi:hypothetical protein
MELASGLQVRTVVAALLPWAMLGRSSDARWANGKHDKRA